MDSNTSLYLVVGVVAIPIILKILVNLEYYIKRRKIVKREYNYSRGTAHKTLLHEHSKKLRKLIKKKEDTLKKHRTKKLQTENEKTAELEKAATIYVFHRDFTNISGIGKKLKERVERSVFNGTLDSLYNASRVHGIGERKYNAIYRWINNTKRTLPHIVSSNFTGKTEIVKRYEKQLNDIDKDILAVRNKLQPLKELITRSERELEKLEQVTGRTFLESYSGDEEASKLVTEYFHGLFPEWTRMPSWFRELMEVTT